MGEADRAAALQRRYAEAVQAFGPALERLARALLAIEDSAYPIDLLYLEQLDAVSIGEVTGLSPANVATKVSRLKQLLVQRFHGGSSS